MDQVTGDTHPKNEIAAEEKQSSSSSKPVIERRRRARINEYLSQLKLLLMDDICDKPGRLSRIDKAELLELAVNHVQKHRTNEGIKPFDTYQAGFNECLWSLNSMLSGQEEENTLLRLRVQEHMASYLHQRKEARHELDYLNLPRNTGHTKQMQNINMGQFNYPTENMTGCFQGQQSNAQGHGGNIFHPMHNLYPVPPQYGKTQSQEEGISHRASFHPHLHSTPSKQMSQTFTPTRPHGISQNIARTKQHEVKKPMALKPSATCTSSATGWKSGEAGHDVMKPNFQVKGDHSSSPLYAEIMRSQSNPSLTPSGGNPTHSLIPNYESSMAVTTNRCIFDTPTNKREKNVSRISRSKPLYSHMNLINSQAHNKPASTEISNTPDRREPGLVTQSFTPIQRGRVLPPIHTMSKLYTPEELHKFPSESSNKYTPIIAHDGTVIGTPSHFHHQVARKLLPTDQSGRMRSHPYWKR